VVEVVGVDELFAMCEVAEVVELGEAVQ